jgi:hypothetical protein
MTTLARIEANQRNAQLSTGPRTADGKAAVARNATRHGIFAAVPVLPGECPEAWETHRAGVVDSLAPVGLLEVNLAARAALLLWRLQRLARYEAETTASEMENVDLPPLPPPEEEFASLNRGPQQMTRDQQLRDIRTELRTAIWELTDVTPARDFFNADPKAGADTVAPFAVAECILEAAYSRAKTSEQLRTDPPSFASKGYMRKLEMSDADPQTVTWTAELIRRGVVVYAGSTGEPTERFVEAVRADLNERTEELARKVRRLEAEVVAVTRHLDGRTARKQTAKLLPSQGLDERIAKYERHLHSLLTSTLHELERLQARREGDRVPPPAVADVNVTVEVGPG